MSDDDSHEAQRDKRGLDENQNWFERRKRSVGVCGSDKSCLHVRERHHVKEFAVVVEGHTRRGYVCFGVSGQRLRSLSYLS